MTAWDLLVAREDLSKTRLVDTDEPSAGKGEAVLKLDRVGLTANNVTYAVLGDAMSYWTFFPADEGWGRVPMWGFAEVEQSEAEGAEPGPRVYGYLPPSSWLVVPPARAAPSGFVDGTPYRAELP